MKHSIIFIIIGWATTLINAFGAVASVRWYNNRELVDLFSIPLDSGDANVSDGALIQLGYYSNAVNSTPFVGEWIVLVGAAIGDSNANVDGFFDIVSSLTDPSLVLPVEGTPLAIRFYDSFTVEQSQNYNAVSNTTGAWSWSNSADPNTIMELALIKPTASIPSSLGLRFEYNSADWKTAIAVPETSSAFMVLVLSLSFGFRRKRIS